MGSQDKKMSWILGTSVPNRDRKESFGAERESGNELGVGDEEMSGREKMVRMSKRRGVREAVLPWKREGQRRRSGNTGRVPGRTGD